MSGDMHCQEALAKVYLYLDQEMPDTESAEFKAHVEDCAPCLEEVGIEQQVKALVSRCCGDEQASEDLRSQILSKLRTAGVQS